MNNQNIIYRGKDWIIFERNGKTMRKSIANGQEWELKKGEWEPVLDVDAIIKKVLDDMPKAKYESPFA